MTAFDPGNVRVTVRAGSGAGGAATSCEVLGTRPDIAARLRGTGAEQAVGMVSMLFSICARAQGLAARLALAAARGAACAPHHDAGVAAEAAREHAWRLLLDWPALLGMPVDRPAFANLVAEISAGRNARWQRPDWIESLPTGDGGVALLPALDVADSLACWPHLDADFAHLPRWQGAAAETGAHARRGGVDGSGVRARVLARARELESHLRGERGRPGRASAVPIAPGTGRALVETARGMLLHEIELQGGKIARYVIVAPTDWNFPPDGPLARHIAGAGPVREVIEAWILALDPCVPWSLELD